MCSLPYADLPTIKDELGFTPLATTLAQLVNQSHVADTPLTLGIYGAWGSGKTSMMQMILDRLDPQCCLPVWFDAWRYTQQEALWRALLRTIVEGVRRHFSHEPTWFHRYMARQEAEYPDNPPDAEKLKKDITENLDHLIAMLYRTLEHEIPGQVQFQWDQLAQLVATSLLRAGFAALPVVGQVSHAVEKAGELLGEEDYVTRIRNLFQKEHEKVIYEQVQSLEQFLAQFEKLIRTYLTNLDYRLVIFIDDLDRCLPEQAVGVLEAIKVWLDVTGCVVVLGVDREIIEHAISIRYKDMAPHSAAVRHARVTERDYMEKIVQIPCTLPPLDPADLTAFLRQRLPSSGITAEETNNVATLMVAGLNPNPRKLKRTFNLFRLHMLFDRAHGRTTAAALIAKLSVIQVNFVDLYARIGHDPLMLREIESGVRGGKITDEDLDQFVKKSSRLKACLAQAPYFYSLSDQQLQELVYQTHRLG